MNHKLKCAFVIALFAAAQVVAQATAAPPKAERKTAEATWTEGKLKIEYGSPAWKDEYKDQMKEMKDPWRLGNNLPTVATLTSGLETAQGALPPGEYRVALKPGADNRWSLLFYEAQTFYDKAF